MKNKVIGLATCAALAATVIGQPSAYAADTITVHVSATLTGTLTPAGVSCDLHGCDLLFTGHGTWTGDFTGTDTFTARAHPLPDGTIAWHTTTATLAGTIGACGTGSGGVHVDGTITGSRLSPAGFTGTSTWYAIPGTGTGDLTGIVSAGGTETDFFGVDGSIRDQTTATVECSTPSN